MSEATFFRISGKHDSHVNCKSCSPFFLPNLLCFCLNCEALATLHSSADSWGRGLQEWHNMQHTLYYVLSRAQWCSSRSKNYIVLATSFGRLARLADLQTCSTCTLASSSLMSCGHQVILQTKMAKVNCPRRRSSCMYKPLSGTGLKRRLSWNFSHV